MSYVKIASDDVIIRDRTEPGSKETWTFEIHEKDGEEADLSLGVLRDPLFIQGARGNVISYPFNPVQIQFTIAATSNLRERFSGRGKKDFKLFVKNSSEEILYELYLYLPSRKFVYFESTSELPVIATNGIGFLEDKAFDSGVFSDVNVSFFLGLIFQELGLNYPIEFYTEYFSSDNKTTFPYNYKLNVVEYIQFDSEPTYIKVLENFCDRFNLDLFLHENRWVFIEKRLRNQASDTLVGINISDGSVVSIDLESLQNTNSIKRFPNADFKAGLKQVKTEFNFASDLFKNPNLAEYKYYNKTIGTANILGWNQSSSPQVFQEELDRRIVLGETVISQETGQSLSNSDSSKDWVRIYFEIDVNIPWQYAGSFEYEYFKLQFVNLAGDVWTMNQDGSFTSGTSANVPFSITIENGSGTLKNIKEFTVPPPVGETGYFLVSIGSDHPGDLGGGTTIKVFNVEFDIDESKSKKTVIAKNSLELKNEHELIFKAGDLDEFSNKMVFEYLNNSDQWVPADYIVNDAGLDDLDVNSSRDRLALQNKEEIEFGTFTLQRYSIAHFLKTLRINFGSETRNFIPREIKWEMTTGVVEVYANEAVFDTSGIIIETSYGELESGGEEAVTTASESSSGSPSPSTYLRKDSNLADLQDVSIAQDNLDLVPGEDIQAWDEILDDISANLTASVDELNYLDGVTGLVQEQLDELESYVLKNHLAVDFLATDKVSKGQFLRLIAGNALSINDETERLLDGDLSWTLSLIYNANNLQLSGGELNTIQDIDPTASPLFASVNTGQGNNELYPMDQSVRSTDPVVFTTVDTGQGANELYAMDQAVRSTDAVDFDSLQTTNDVDVGGALSVVLNAVIGGNVTITGDLVVNGNQVIQNTETVEVEDNIMLLNKGEAGSGVTGGASGLRIDRGTSDDFMFLFDEIRNRFVVGTGSDETAPSIAALQVVATREDAPTDGGVAFFNAATNRFETGDITSDGNDVFFGSGTIGSDHFASQLTGWRIDYAGTADFRSIFADELRVQAFTADVAQAFRGSRFLTKSFGTLAATFTVPNAVGQTGALTVRDVEGFAGYSVFEEDDIVLIPIMDTSNRSLFIGRAWGEVTGYTDNQDGTQTWTFELLNAGTVDTTGMKAYTGNEALSFGSIAAPSGFIEDTVLDTQGSPYSRVVTWTTNPWTPANYTVQTQIGNLAGLTINGQNLSGYGGYFKDNFYVELAGGLGYFGKGADGANDNGFYIDEDNYWLINQGFKVQVGGSDLSTNLSNINTDIFNIQNEIDGVDAAILDIQSDLINLFLISDGAYSGIQALAGQLILSTNQDGKITLIRLDSTGEESVITIAGDQIDITANTSFTALSTSVSDNAQAIIDQYTTVTQDIADATADFLTGTQITTQINGAVAGLATEVYVGDEIATATADFLTAAQITTEINNATNGLASETFVNTAISGLAAESYVNSEIASATANFLTSAQIAQDITDATTGLASETYVTNATAGLALESYVDGEVANASATLSALITTNENDITTVEGSVLDLTSDLINLFLQIDGAYSGVQFLAGQLTLTVDDNDKIALVRLDATGEESVISIAADQLNIDATTTFSSGYDPTTKETPQGAQDKVNSLQSDLDTIFDNAVQNGTTIISGGFIETSLLDVDDILAQNATVTGVLTIGTGGEFVSDILNFDKTSFALEAGDFTIDSALKKIAIKDGVNDAVLIDDSTTTSGGFESLKTATDRIAFEINGYSISENTNYFYEINATDFDTNSALPFNKFVEINEIEILANSTEETATVFLTIEGKDSANNWNTIVASQNSFSIGTSQGNTETLTNPLRFFTNPSFSLFRVKIAILSADYPSTPQTFRFYGLNGRTIINSTKLNKTNLDVSKIRSLKSSELIDPFDKTNKVVIEYVVETTSLTNKVHKTVLKMFVGDELVSTEVLQTYNETI